MLYYKVITIIQSNNNIMRHCISNKMQRQPANPAYVFVIKVAVVLFYWSTNSKEVHKLCFISDNKMHGAKFHVDI